MYEQLKTEIKEIIEIVNQCPEALKERCFELLLENYLKSWRKPEKIVQASEQHIEVAAPTQLPEEPDGAKANSDIALKDFHVKTQRFLQTNGISLECINALYYREGGRILPLYETLNSTSMSECQIRLALLTAFENSVNDNNGEMTFNCEVIRNRCQTMKCYSAKNFSAYFKNNAGYWESWPEKYDKDFIVSLSVEGKKALAALLLELASGNI